MTIMLDRANVNGPDNYDVAHDRGLVRWAAFKASEGAGFVDQTYHSRRKEARAAGIVTGAYMFSDNTDPAAEVKLFLDVIGDPGHRVGELRPTIDIERSPHGIPTLAHTIELAQRLRHELGYWPIIYGSTSVIEPYRAASLIVRACPWWRAEYGPNDGRDHALMGGDLDAAIHQYTSVGRVTGISGFTDVSHILRPDQMLVPKPKPAKPKITPATHWRWARWYLGIAEYQGHQRDPEMRPKHAPRVIPLAWFRYVRWYKRNVINPAKRQAKLDAKAAAAMTDESPTVTDLTAGLERPIVDGNGKPIPVGGIATPSPTSEIIAAPRRSHHRKPSTKENQ